MDGSDVDAIIVATATPDTLFPSTACLMQKTIGAKKAFAYDIAAACSGFIFALAQGQQLPADRGWPRPCSSSGPSA